MLHYTGPGPADGAGLRDARQLAGMRPEDAAALVGKHRTTWVRMERGAARVCRASLALVWIMGGNFPWDGWPGWRIGEDRLLYPPGWRARGFLPGEIMHVALVFQQVAALRRRVAELEAELTALRTLDASSSAARSARAPRPLPPP